MCSQFPDHRLQEPMRLPRLARRSGRVADHVTQSSRCRQFRLLPWYFWYIGERSKEQCATASYRRASGSAETVDCDLRCRRRDSSPANACGRTVDTAKAVHVRTCAVETKGAIPPTGMQTKELDHSGRRTIPELSPVLSCSTFRYIKVKFDFTYFTKAAAICAAPPRQLCWRWWEASTQHGEAMRSSEQSMRALCLTAPAPA